MLLMAAAADQEAHQRLWQAVMAARHYVVAAAADLVAGTTQRLPS
jgi:hypothetical protein